MTRENNGWNLDNSYASLPSVFYSNIKPTPVSSPELVILNEPLAISLGLDAEGLKSNEGVEVFAGNRLPNDSFPIAQAYAGHQYGSFTMLGDGRAVLVGEQITPDGERLDIQLKGSGRTPYSRHGDGRAVLGPMLREYIISEAMFALGIPTTRSLAVVTTGEEVYRHHEDQGAILTRVAASHIRVGTFQYIANWGSIDELRALADYTIKRHYPYINEDGTLKYQNFLKEVIKRQAQLITKWQLIGFVHGVMNTDNMTISGETIDYGPCAFMDSYDPSTVFSSIDRNGRYAYGNQPFIASWNLSRFAETLLPLIHENQEEAIKIATEIISLFPKLYHDYWLAGMRAKLGLSHEDEEDESLIDTLLKIMHKNRADFTNTFRNLTLDTIIETNLYGKPDFMNWYDNWKKRISKEESFEISQELMKKTNPAIIPRNHRVEEALDKARNGDLSVMKELLNVLKCPYSYTSFQENYIQPKHSNERYVTFCGT